MGHACKAAANLEVACLEAQCNDRSSLHETPQLACVYGSNLVSTGCSGPYLLSVQCDIAVQRLEQEVEVAVLACGAVGWQWRTVLLREATLPPAGGGQGPAGWQARHAARALRLTAFLFPRANLTQDQR